METKNCFHPHWINEVIITKTTIFLNLTKVFQILSHGFFSFSHSIFFSLVVGLNLNLHCNIIKVMRGSNLGNSSVGQITSPFSTELVCSLVWSLSPLRPGLTQENWSQCGFEWDYCVLSTINFVHLHWTTRLGWREILKLYIQLCSIVLIRDCINFTARSINLLLCLALA